jgi:hypothetical protein
MDSLCSSDSKKPYVFTFDGEKIAKIDEHFLKELEEFAKMIESTMHIINIPDIFEEYSEKYEMMLKKDNFKTSDAKNLMSLKNKKCFIEHLLSPNTSTKIVVQKSQSKQEPLKVDEKNPFLFKCENEKMTIFEFFSHAKLIAFAKEMEMKNCCPIVIADKKDFFDKRIKEIKESFSQMNDLTELVHLTLLKSFLEHISEKSNGCTVVAMVRKSNVPVPKHSSEELLQEKPQKLPSVSQLFSLIRKPFVFRYDRASMSSINENELFEILQKYSQKISIQCENINVLIDSERRQFEHFTKHTNVSHAKKNVVISVMKIAFLNHMLKTNSSFRIVRNVQ